MAPLPDDWDLDLDNPQGGAGDLTDSLSHAAVLMRRDPLRHGNVVHLPAQGDAVILGDLHGDVENFARVVKWAALHRNRDRYLVLQELIHGGPLDGDGCDDSFRLLEQAAALKVRYRSQVQMVLSNHDLAELVGVEVTKSGRPTAEPFHRGIEKAYGAAAPTVLGAYRTFLVSLPLAVRTPNGVFISHSTPDHAAMETFDFGVFDQPIDLRNCGPGTSLYELVWGRDYRQCCADKFAEAVGAEVLVTGHQTSMPGLKTPTTRHLVLTSDGPLGRFVVVPLAAPVLPGPLARQVRKVRSLEA